jgi:Ribbon-helix-helix protein, copG family
VATRVFALRLGEAELERLERLAEEAGASRADVLRRLLADGQALRLPVPGRGELLELLGGLARSGSVRAIELLLREQHADALAASAEAQAARPRVSRIDELAARRRAGSA